MKYFLNGEDLIYTRALLFTWESDSNPSSFSETNGQFFVSQFNRFIECSSSETVVINCNHISDIDDHALNAINELVRESKLNFIFYSSDSTHAFCEYLEAHFENSDLNTDSRTLNSCNRFFKIEQNQSINNVCLTKIKEEAEKIEKKAVTKLIASSYVKTDDDFKLSSTPLKATGHFNANMINSQPSSFRWIVSIMSEVIQQEVTKSQFMSYTIVASSLRGVTIAASVREVLHYVSNVGFHIFDHFGPKHDLKKLPISRTFKEKEQCIYVGDFLIGGTEVKLTQTYCSSLGGELSKAFVLGKYTKSNKLGHNIAIQSIVQLSDCITDLKYELV